MMKCMREFSRNSSHEAGVLRDLPAFWPNEIKVVRTQIMRGREEVVIKQSIVSLRTSSPEEQTIHNAQGTRILQHEVGLAVKSAYSSVGLINLT